MSFSAVIDTSAIIWDQDKFQTNQAPYYQLAEDLLHLIETIGSEDPNIILRGELLEEMINGFPAQKLDGIPYFRELVNNVYTYLANLPNFANREQFEAVITPDLSSAPDLVETHYNPATTQEMQYLITHLHFHPREPKYFTFEATWTNPQAQLSTTEQDNRVHETIICNEKSLKNFYQRFQRTFEHNPKHAKTKYLRFWKGRKISPLSCFDGRNQAIPQNLLSLAVNEENTDDYFYYDAVNDTYVCFYNHLANKYHGFDVEPHEMDPKTKELVDIKVNELAT